VGAAAAAAESAPPALSSLFGRIGRPLNALQWTLGGTLAALMLVATEAALGLVFDPRYRNIPFAPLTAAVVPFLAVRLWTSPGGGRSARAERVASVMLAVSAVYVVFNEAFANWQSVWFCAVLLVLAFILWRARDAPS
jgi:glucan 1,3-beta-glucosidase